MESVDYLEKRHKQLSEEVERLERKRKLDRSSDSKIQLLKLKKEKLRIKDKINEYRNAS